MLALEASVPSESSGYMWYAEIIRIPFGDWGLVCRGFLEEALMINVRKILCLVLQAQLRHIGWMQKVLHHLGSHTISPKIR